MKSKYLKFLPLFLIFALFANSCSLLPSERVARAQEKVAQTKEQINNYQDELVEKARNYVFGANYTLQLDTNPNVFTKTAEKMTSRAELVLGPPVIEQANQIKEIANDLVSNNVNLNTKGDELLVQKDEEIIILQNNIKHLNDQLEIKEKKSNSIALEMSAFGDTWYKIKHYFYYILWFIGIFLFLSLLGKILPPPYNSIVNIVAIPMGLIIKGVHALFPAAKQAAGVVAVATYNQTKKTLENVVDSIEQTKDQISNKQVQVSQITPIVPAVSTVVSNPIAPLINRVLTEVEQHPGMEQLKTNLRSNLDEDDKTLINRTKEELGYI